MATASDNPTTTQLALSLPLQGRVAIVTGSSRGIGKAIAIHLASLGANLVVNYSSNKDQADAVSRHINSSYPNTRAIVIGADVSDPTHVKSMFDEAEAVFGSPVSVLVNSAGVLDPKLPSIANASLEEFDRIFSINTRGAFICCKEGANRLKRGGGGRIILLSSSMVGALRPGFGVYAASKAAIETMMKILAKELKGIGVTANCVAPGPVATEMYFSGKSGDQIKRNMDENPLSRLGETKDIATIVGFLATDAGDWINGQVIRANGGYV